MSSFHSLIVWRIKPLQLKSVTVFQLKHLKHNEITVKLHLKPSAHEYACWVVSPGEQCAVVSVTSVWVNGRTHTCNRKQTEWLKMARKAPHNPITSSVYSFYKDIEADLQVWLCATKLSFSQQQPDIPNKLEGFFSAGMHKPITTFSWKKWLFSWSVSAQKSWSKLPLSVLGKQKSVQVHMVYYWLS